jgi:hypothetical protein
MSKVLKSIAQKGILFNVQYEMCDMVYRKLHELMVSVNELNLEIEFKSTEFLLKCAGKNIEFYRIGRNGRVELGYVPLDKISIAQIECPMMLYIMEEYEFSKSRPETYSEWFDVIKCKMQDLLVVQQKYETLLDSIKNIPLFSPTREVLLEKINH